MLLDTTAIKKRMPDILDTIANLSSDEVFTPPKLANQILDILPPEVWSNPDLKWLDPACKTGIFLREIARRLMVGLQSQIPDEKQRREHILKNMLYGIAVTDLTALMTRRTLYTSKYANNKLSVAKFDSPNGNISHQRIEHSYKNGNCIYCGVKEGQYDRGDELENYAYNFIHNQIPNNMKFDVIIGNPPYQLNDGGGTGSSAMPIYHKFVQQAIKLKPKYISFIIPSRWFAGGKGLDDFRSEMLGDTRIKKIVDFENSNEVFPGVDIAGGVMYFLWDKNHNGDCEVVNQVGEEQTSTERKLNEFPIFIRQSKALPIIKKIIDTEKPKKFLNEVISSRKPFGIASNYQSQTSGIPCYFTQKIGLKFANPADISDEQKILPKWKLLIPFAPIAGQTDFSKPVKFYYDSNVIIAKPGQCCTETYLVACAFDTKAKVESFKSYLFTKTVRFLLLQTVVSQNVTRERFIFIPDLESYTQTFTDEILRKRWGITDKEWQFIDSRIG